MVQHQLTRHDLGRSRIRRQPRRQRVRRRRPGHQRQPGDPDRLPDRVDRSAPAVLRRQRAEHVRIRRRVRLDAGHRLLLQLRHQRLRLAADQADQALLRRLLGSGELHAAARDPGQPRLLLLRLGDEPRPGRLGSHAQLHVVGGRGTAVRPRAALLARMSHRWWTRSSAAGRRTPTRSSTAACRSA